ncbi:MAG: extracellular solute-binding protein, partial [Clostridia bacterium]
MKKLLCVLLCMVLLASLPLAATTAEDQVILTFTYKQSASDDPLERWVTDQNIIGQFEATHPGVKIELRPIASTEGDYATLLALQLSSEKTAPDIFMEDTYMTATDAAAGYLACLDDELAAWVDYAHYVHGAKAAVLGADGKSYGIPISTDSRGIWYSIPVLEAAGIKTPWQPASWEEILDAARKIKAYSDANSLGIQPLHLTVGAINGEAVSMQTFEMLLYGTKDLMYENGKWLVAGPGLNDTFQFIENVYKEGVGLALDIALSADGLPTVVAHLFPNAGVGMSMNVSTLVGYWLPGAAAPIENITEKIGFAAMPTQNGDPATVTICGGWSWAISAYCEHKDLAFEFLS